MIVCGVTSPANMTTETVLWTNHLGLWPFAGGVISSFCFRLACSRSVTFVGQTGFSCRVQEVISIDAGAGLDKLLGQFPTLAVNTDQC